ncbi:MAG: alpha/beta fold hydrolase [Candidatus Promineifilaceae bacterium]|nr:alpha/beta fold hydrolase [Candidatus Promineifilaceae bacterium]
MTTRTTPQTEIRLVTFTSQGHGVRGRLFIPAGGEPSDLVLLLPGFPGNEKDVLGVGERLARAGIGALMFNYRGTYGSEGDYSLPHAQEDIAAAHAFLLSERVPASFRTAAGDLVVGGYSFGGGMGLTYTANNPSIRRAFSIAGTDHGAFMRIYERDSEFRSMVNEMFTSLAYPEGPVRFAATQSRPDIASQKINMKPYDLRRVAPALANRHLLFLWGWDDVNNRVEHHLVPLYRALVDAGASRVRIETYATDHQFGNVQEGLAADIVDWLGDTSPGNAS